jgi:choline kinase
MADEYIVVSIAEPESISPLMQAMDGQPRKQYNAGVARRLSGRPPPSTASSRASIVSQKSMEDLPEAALSSSPNEGRAHHSHNRHRHERLLTQVAEWLQAEKAKRVSRKAKKHHASKTKLPEESQDLAARPSSRGSDSSALSLEKLQKILEESMADFGIDPSASPSILPRRQHLPRRRSSARTLVRTASSDTEYQDGDVIVPSCDVILDNTKTLSYSGGGASSSDLNLLATGKRAERERRAWTIFKSEILRLAHTLRLKGWRRIPLENGDDIDVERLSGALTNAVYVVSPPKDLPLPSSTSGSGVVSSRRPSKLLLRIYGPQVEHLIDRENELGILRRLARKKIGPRLLGTFRNGRFEEFFDSTTLTSTDLRVPETSKQIAKRMRELHDGIELLEQERQDGPFVWRNWDKWVERCELVIKYLDDQILSGKAGPARSKSEAWKARGLICGVEWPVFREVIEKYRQFLMEHYGGAAEVRKQLVFAHNDVSLYCSEREMYELTVPRHNTAISSASNRPANLPFSSHPTPTNNSSSSTSNTPPPTPRV